MNLRGLANAATVAINPNIPVEVLRSTGYTMGAGARQVPTYAAPVVGVGQMQALDGDELKQLEGMNMQGTIRALYIYGFAAGVIRPNQTGGDLVNVTNAPGFPGKREWLVTKVLEAWPDWVKVAVTLQGQ
jgi:hypothetical protein